MYDLTQEDNQTTVNILLMLIYRKEIHISLLTR